MVFLQLSNKVHGLDIGWVKRLCNFSDRFAICRYGRTLCRSTEVNVYHLSSFIIESFLLTETIAFSYELEILSLKSPFQGDVLYSFQTLLGGLLCESEEFTD